MAGLNGAIEAKTGKNPRERLERLAILYAEAKAAEARDKEAEHER